MIKKRWLLALLVCCAWSMALAEDWLSVAELRQQTPDRWMRTFDTPWRTVDIDAEIRLPKADRMPVVMVRGGAVEPEPSAVKESWDMIELRGAYLLSAYNVVPDYPRKVNGVRVGPPYAEGNWYSGFQPENRYVPMDETTFGEIVKLAREAILALGYDPECFALERPARLWTHHVGEYGKRNDVLPGYLMMDVRACVQGIPVLGHVQEAHIGDEVAPQDNREFWQNTVSTISYNGYLGGLSGIALCPVEVCEVLAEDVPLCALDSVLAAVEAEIHAGHIRKIYELELGYVLYNEPGRYVTEKSSKARAAELHTARFFAVPMWQINCLYSESPRGEPRVKPSDSDDERNTLDYRRLLIDAQTGEWVIQSQAEDRCAFKGFLSWDEG